MSVNENEDAMEIENQQPLNRKQHRCWCLLSIRDVLMTRRRLKTIKTVKFD